VPPTENWLSLVSVTVPVVVAWRSARDRRGVARRLDVDVAAVLRAQVDAAALVAAAVTPVSSEAALMASTRSSPASSGLTSTEVMAVPLMVSVLLESSCPPPTAPPETSVALTDAVTPVRSARVVDGPRRGDGAALVLRARERCRPLALVPRMFDAVHRELAALQARGVDLPRW
jgi:hypothetical protein